MKITIESENNIASIAITLYNPDHAHSTKLAEATKSVQAITESLKQNIQENSQEDFQSQTEERFT